MVAGLTLKEHFAMKNTTLFVFLRSKHVLFMAFHLTPVRPDRFYKPVRSDFGHFVAAKMGGIFHKCSGEKNIFFTPAKKLALIH
jgi:hypothetical protein